MCNHGVAMEVIRELEIDAPADEVWALLEDPDELAAWVGDDVRRAELAPLVDGERRRSWRWAPDGVASDVEVAVEEAGERTRVRVVERVAAPAAPGPSARASARACVSGDAWDDRLFGLEVRWLTRAHALVRA